MIKIENIKIEKIENEKDKKYITRGLRDYGLSEIVINLALDEFLAKEIINLIIIKLRKGEKFVEGYLKDEFTCPIYIKQDEDIMKLIFPDPFMRFPWDTQCQSPYRNQI